MTLADYWEAIPECYDNRKTYDQLCHEWKVSRRYLRLILHRLSGYDNGDGFVLIRSGHSKGFYKTDDKEAIEKYGREVMAKAISHFAPMKKVRRILGEDDTQLRIDL